MFHGEKLPPRGKTYKYKKLEYWAQGGTICIEDTGDENDQTRFNTVNVPTFLERAVTVKRCIHKVNYRYVDERLEDEKFVEEAARCVREAMNQGDPFDPKVLEYYYKHRSRGFFVVEGGRVSTSRALSQSQTGDQGRDLPPMPQAPANKPFVPLIS